MPSLSEIVDVVIGVDTHVETHTAVSYTHLDVYKRQVLGDVIEQFGFRRLKGLFGLRGGEGQTFGSRELGLVEIVLQAVRVIRIGIEGRRHRCSAQRQMLQWIDRLALLPDLEVQLDLVGVRIAHFGDLLPLSLIHI